MKRSTVGSGGSIWEDAVKSIEGFQSQIFTIPVQLVNNRPVILLKVKGRVSLELAYCREM